MNNVKTNNGKNSNLPLLIISGVLLAAVIGGWWFYSNSKSQPIVKSNTNRNVNKTPPKDTIDPRIATAPPGAQPANMLGSPTATVTVEEFADYQCPTCAVTHPKMQELTKLYGNRIKFIYRSYPLTQIHANAYDASVAAEAAGLQNKFWEMQNQLFSNQKEWSTSSDARKLFSDYAQKIGLDINKYQNDSLGLAAKARVDADMQRGRAIGITGTPSIYINGKPLAFEQFEVAQMRQIIDAELQKASSQPSGQATNQAVVVQSNNATNGNAK
jgi:protein-disulfide isomerase